MFTPITDKTIEKIFIYRWGHKYTLDDIANKLIIARSTVANYLKKHENYPEIFERAREEIEKITGESFTAPIRHSARPKNNGDKARDWLKTNPEGTYNEYRTVTKNKIATSHFYKIRKEIKEGKKTKKQAKNKSNGVKATSLEPTTTKINRSLQEENDFLKWWNQGERKGWVTKLLDELNN